MAYSLSKRLEAMSEIQALDTSSALQSSQGQVETKDNGYAIFFVGGGGGWTRCIMAYVKMVND